MSDPKETRRSNGFNEGWNVWCHERRLRSFVAFVSSLYSDEKFIENENNFEIASLSSLTYIFIDCDRLVAFVPLTAKQTETPQVPD